MAPAGKQGSHDERADLTKKSAATVGQQDGFEEHVPRE